MEKIVQKTILETNLQLSTAYTIAFGKPTSKYEIQKYLTKSHRHTTIIDDHKECFSFIKRPDKRMGVLIQSKPEILVELIESKTRIDPKSRILLLQLLSNKFIAKSMNNTLQKAITSGYRPINHYLLFRYLMIILLGSYINKEYDDFFQPKLKRDEYLKKSDYLDRHFLPWLYDEDKQTKPDKYSLQAKEIIRNINHETKKEIIFLAHDHRVLIRLVKQGIIMSESNKATE